MSKITLFCLALLLGITTSTKAELPISLSLKQTVDRSDLKAIKASMAISENMWNTRDFVGFMHNYWKSEELKFVGKEGINYGWDATLNRYINSYPDKDSSGKLTFELKTFEYIGDKDHMLVIGSYHLEREVGDASGHFSLIWKRMDGMWKIIVDHSS